MNGAHKKQKGHPKIKWEQENPQAIGDKQYTNCAQDFPMILEQGLSK